MAVQVAVFINRKKIQLKPNVKEQKKMQKANGNPKHVSEALEINLWTQGWETEELLRHLKGEK